MSVKAKCHNYTGCLLAYRGEEVELPTSAPLVCPECGKSVTVVTSKSAGVGKALLWLVILGVLGAGLYFAKPMIAPLFTKKAATEEATPAPENPSQPFTASTPAPSNAGSNLLVPPQVVMSEPPKAPSAPAKLNLSLASSENVKVRDDVLKRIDLMPNISQVNKDKLYNSVQRARSMGIVVTIPFSSGNTHMAPSDVPALKAEMEKPAIMKLRDDPTAVFVVLGYADQKGDEKKNIAISQARAESVVGTMRDKCGIANVMHAVAMGGSTLIDASKLEKNRVAEVWAVLP